MKIWNLNPVTVTFELQVAEVGDEIVGVIRGSVKDVVCSQSALICSEKASIRIPIYSRVGYLLGLRVCPSHRYCIFSNLLKFDTPFQSP